MKHIANNKFYGGMNKDLGRSIMKPTQYLNADNMRLMSYSNNEGGEISNIKGNVYSFGVDSISDCYSISVADGTYSPSTWIFLVNGVQISVSWTSSQTNVSIIELIQDAFDASSDIDVNTSIIDNVLYVTSDSYTSYTLTTNVAHATIATYYSSISDLKIIGYCNIRSETILFTTNNDEDSPTASYGQLWSVIYDDTTSTPTPTVTLLYNGLLNFSIQNPIEAVSYYENTNVRKIYWTDNYNYLRFANVGDDMLLTYDVDDFSILSDVSLSKPTLNKVKTGGSLYAGMIQYSYQLYNTSGGETVFSPVSNFVHLTDSAETDATSADYKGADKGTDTGKSVDIDIADIDTSYDNIRIVSLFYEDLTDTPEITIIYEGSVPPSGKITVSNNGSELLGTYTLAEFNTLGGSLFTCKTLAIKDNMLFPANITYSTFNVDFDARSYRFRSGTTTSYVDIDTTDEDNWGVPIDADCVNPYNSQTEYSSSNLYMYRRGDTILGGSGPNIDYRFKIERVESDNNGSDRTLEANNVTFQDLKQWSFENNNYSYSNTASPYISDLFKGYQRDEVYAFGIVLYNKQGQPSEAKWIADIRMPAISDNDGVPTYTDAFGGQYDFSITSIGTNGGVYCNVLTLQFDVRIPSGIADQVGGFEIVRMQRGSDDRTIMAQGYCGLAVKNSFGATTVADVPLGTTYIDNFQSTINDGCAYLLYSPEVSFNNNLEHRSGDISRVTAAYQKVDASLLSTSIYTNEGTTQELLKIRKVMTFTNRTSLMSVRDVTINDGAIVSPSESSVDIYTYPLYNSGVNNTIYKFWGGTVFAFEPDNRFPVENSAYSKRYYLINYVRPRSDQYGGSTYNARLNREYISTGSYQAVVGAGSYNVNRLFGGDTFVTFFDCLKAFWKLDPSDRKKGRQYVMYFPVESSINIPLSSGDEFHRLSGEDQRLVQELAGTYSAVVDDGSGLYTQAKDYYVYNSVYSKEYDSRKYYPKQFNVNENDIYDTRILSSQKKTPGEEVDSWTQFLPADFIDINSSYGQINKVINKDNRIFAFQDNAFGVASINEKSLISDGNAAELVLGTGDVLSRFDYISTDTGSKHQWSVLGAPSGIYWYDVNKKNMMLFSSRTLKMSDIWGMNRYYSLNVYGDMFVNDNPHYGGGVNGYYDDEYNEVVYTFSNHTRETVTSVQTSHILTTLENTTVSAGDTVTVIYKGIKYTETVSAVTSTRIRITNTNEVTYEEDADIYYSVNTFTVSFNDDMKVYNSFYSYYTPQYIKTDNKVLSVSRSASDDVYIHNIGNFGQFYGVYNDSTLDVLVNDQYPSEKIFNSQKFDFVSKNSNDVNIRDDFWSECRWYTDKQNTDWKEPLYKSSMSTLPTDGQVLAVKREHWYNMNLPKNAVSVAGDVDIFAAANLDYTRQWKDRLRDTFLISQFKYDNSNNYSVTLSNIFTEYVDSFR